MANGVNQTTVSGGIGFFGLLTIVLIVLKILGHVQTSWIVILLLPIWGPILMILTILIVVFGGGLVLLGGAALLDWFNSQKRK